MEKVIIKGNKSSAAKVGIIGGVIVAVIVFVICISIYEIQYYWDTSLFGAAVGGLLVGLLLYFWLGKMELVVSNKRVYGSAAFGKRVDLPIDSITAVGTSWLNGIDVTTASGAIKFKLMKNNAEVHAAISKLIVDRQDKAGASADAAVRQESAPDDVERLKKYKELLDTGVISQEEFDAKKKQLLGL